MLFCKLDLNEKLSSIEESFKMGNNYTNVNRAKTYEKAVLNYIQGIANNNNRELVLDNKNLLNGWDAYAPNGISLEHDYPLCIEVKFFSGSKINNGILFQVLSKFDQYLLKNYTDDKMLLITNISDKEIERVIKNNLVFSHLWEKIKVMTVRIDMLESYGFKENEEIDNVNNSVELVFSYIQGYRNIVDPISINYTDYIEIEYKLNELLITKIDKKLKLYPKYISNITAIVGRNGAGKSNLCDYISNNFMDNTSFFNVYKSNNYYFVNGNINPFDYNVQLAKKTSSFYSYQCEIDNGRLYRIDSSIKDIVNIVHYKKNLKIYDTTKKNRTLIVKRHHLNDSKHSFTDKITFLRRILKDNSRFCSMFANNEYKIEISIKNYLDNISIDHLNSKSTQISNDYFYLNLLIAFSNSYEVDIKLRDTINRDIINGYSLYNRKVDLLIDLCHEKMSQSGIFDPYISQLKKIRRGLNDMPDLKANNNIIELILSNQTTDFYFSEMMQLIDTVEKLRILTNLISFDINYLTDGEQNVINQFSVLYSQLKTMKQTNCILILDEPETSMHPEYSRKFIAILISFLEELKINTQIIISTHSPFILSDVVKGNVLYISNNGSFKVEKGKHNTFASNINEMLGPSLFMDNTIGEFALVKIKEIIDYINGNKKTEKRDEDYKSIVKIIDDKILRNILLDQLERVDKNAEN